MKKTGLILAIETSCDETSAAVYDVEKGLLSNVVASQIDIHKKTGGVVPEVASRAHVEAILPVIDEALEKANVKLEEINYLAVTHAPGLIGSLLVGVNTAKTLSVVLDKPLLPINHLEGHIYANFINEIDEISNDKLQITNKSQDSKSKKIYSTNPTNPTIPTNPKFNFPAVILLVSGGHTSLILMKGHGQYKTLGETLDDAAGEAFDKVAKVLGMEYPGGPNVSKAAEEYRRKFLNYNCLISNKNFNKLNSKNLKAPKSPGFMFPRSMLNSGDFNFSFSGLKTAVLYAWQKDPQKLMKPKANEAKSLFAYEFEEAVVDILVTKTVQAAKKYGAKTVSICGGVAANKRLREEIDLRIQKDLPLTAYRLPPLQFCGDNAAMIACCAAYRIVGTDLKPVSREVKQNLDFEVMSNKEL